MMEVLEKIKKNYSDEDGELLLSAYKYAEEMHSGQKRASGEPYFTHPCAVAEILIDLGLDTPTVAAAFLGPAAGRAGPALSCFSVLPVF